ncbi:HipA domain-containing protein [Nocardia halotolerans]|uniref:HipA domain-containing protein n=1 Tax=Nocardia halotolerans TaxID=1755878 RepID=A0ABV8VFJ3_9NOCA
MRYIRTSQEAEQNAAARMRAMGFRDAEVTPNGADGGVDVRTASALAQVKWRGAVVSRSDVQKLVGARGDDVGKHLLFFTASGYSAYAVEYADRHRIALFIYEPHGEISVKNATAADFVSVPDIAVPHDTKVQVVDQSVLDCPGPNLDSLSSLHSADIYKAGRLAGSIARRPGNCTEFRYSPSYDGPPLASTLPLSCERVRCDKGAVPPFFAGLLPEGNRLTMLARAASVGVEDELSLLLAVGGDTPGDVQVFPAGTTPVEARALANCSVVDELEFDHTVHSIDRHAIPGAQDKVSASIATARASGVSGRFILKLSQLSYPYLIENEAAHLTAARALKLPVATADLVHDRSGQLGLLVRRFDRVHEGGSWHRLAFEDATQVLGLPPSAKYNIDAIDVVEALAGRVDTPLLAARNLYLQFLFAWLSGNGDLHGKNAGVLRDGTGRWVVAPIYDIPCTLIYGDDSMALPIAGRTKGLRAKHWAQFAAEIGLPAKAAISAQRLALRACATVDFDGLPFTGSPRNRTLRELRLRRAELEDSL